MFGNELIKAGLSRKGDLIVGVGVREKKAKRCDLCGSNTWPLDLQSNALPTELRSLVIADGQGQLY